VHTHILATASISTVINNILHIRTAATDTRKYINIDGDLLPALLVLQLRYCSRGDNTFSSVRMRVCPFVSGTLLFEPFDLDF